MAATLIGAHMPTGGGGAAQAVRDGKAIGCTAVQVFTKSPRIWDAPPLPEAKIADFKAAVTETGIDAVVSHDSYLINLAAPQAEGRARSIEALKAEMCRCGAYGIGMVVSHMGAHMGDGEDVGISRVVEGARSVLADSPQEVTLLMETTAGQGTALNSRFEELAAILEACGRPDRLAVCLDTCHVFAAGYDIRSRDALETTMASFHRLIGIDRLKVIHCNDSKKGLGSRVDRHANLGDGEIGDAAFEMLVKDPRFAQIPMVVETPIEDDGHRRNVAKLWNWTRD
ncbi:MAG: deoxyribonuclease IV [Fimbriimonadaceae bacterium]